MKDARKYIGYMVVVARWSDFDMADPVAVGYLERIEDGRFYIYGNARAWQHCRLVGKRLKTIQKEATE